MTIKEKIKPFCTVNKKGGLTVTFGDEVFYVPNEAIDDLVRYGNNDGHSQAIDALTAKVDQILEIIKDGK